jgi:hypothetical protein
MRVLDWLLPLVIPVIAAGAARPLLRHTDQVIDLRLKYRRKQDRKPLASTR